MPVLPRSLLTSGARFLTSRCARRLRDPRSILPEQSKTFSTLIAAMSRCSFGRENGLQRGMTYSEFHSRVPLRAYEQFTAPIERMKKGEADVLWPGRCRYYAVSSGTTAGRTKYLPITGAMLAHFRRAGLDSLLYYAARVGSTSVFGGKQLFLGGSTTLTRIEESGSFGAWAGDLSGITAIHMPGWVNNYLYEPGAEIAQIGNWPEKIKAIAERTHSRDMRLVAGIPSWILILAAAVQARAAADGKAAATLRSVWPHLECLIHGGVPIGPFVNELRATLGEGVHFHEVYPASEGFIATQDADASLGLRLMTDVGLFFEFLPLGELDDTRLEQLGPKAVPLEGVKAGVDYALLLTTPAGLMRYVIGDVVRFVSTDIPRLVYAGRTKLQLSAFGEHVIEKELTDALAIVSARNNLNVTNFHVAPIFVDSTAGRNRGSHEWWIELKTSGFENVAAAQLSKDLDAELIRLNDDYEAKRKGLGLEPPVIRLVPAGTFEQWMRAHGKWGGQSKMPRCRSDREIADDLARLAR
ncbi:MAG: GH3 auxin-responsive promoter family protein [Nibricoccus sp.]